MSNEPIFGICEWKTDTGIARWDGDRADLNLAIRVFKRAMEARRSALLVIEEVTNRIGNNSDEYMNDLKKMKHILEGKPYFQE